MSGKDKRLISYDKEKDEVKVYVRAYYGHLRWDLSIQQVPLSQARPAIKDEDEYYSFFAYSLLDSQVFSDLKPVLKHLSFSPKKILEKGNLT